MTENPGFVTNDELPGDAIMTATNTPQKSSSSDEGTVLKPSSSDYTVGSIEIEKDEIVKEKWYKQVIQILVPFFIAGFGMVGAGILFSIVQEWDVFVNVNEIIVLVPALLGLKGNLDMSLASRLSTQLNLGDIHDNKTTVKALVGNTALKLLQSIVVGILASFVASLTEFFTKRQFTASNFLILVSSSVTSAAFTSVFLGFIVMSFIIISKRLRLNPDNLATPIAGSIGDVGTLATLACVGSFFYAYRAYYLMHISFIVSLVILCPFLFLFAKRNDFVKSTLYQGWTPVIAAMFISSIAGIILEIALRDYVSISTFQPVINGVGGNLVSIYSSRLSTEMFRDPSTHGKWARWAPKKFYNFPLETFFGKKNPEAKTSHMLMALVIPGHLVFFFLIYVLSDARVKPTLTIWLVLFYLLAAFLQVSLLFIVCYGLVHVIWRIKRNPDDYCISLLTSLGDVFGVCLLYLCFYLVYLTGNTSLKTLETTTTTTTTTNTNNFIGNLTSFNTTTSILTHLHQRSILI